MTNKTSPKQAAVLSLMAQGKTFDAAYREVGLSDYGHNKAEFLLRLVSGGHLMVVPTIYVEEH